MSKKWSQKGTKSTLDANDEFMILDSTDANPATQNKRVKVFTARDSFNGFFETQTIGAVTQTQSFIFNGALTAFIIIAATNATNTKGLCSTVQIICTVTTTNNNISTGGISDFATANVAGSSTSNSVILDMTGEAGETITWRGKIYVIGT